MEFCPGCGNMLQYELLNMHDARFFCLTCPYVAYVDRKGIRNVIAGFRIALAAPQPYNRSAQTSSEWSYTPQPAVEQSNSAQPFVPESGAEATKEGYALEEEEIYLLRFLQMRSRMNCRIWFKLVGLFRAEEE
ncbi:hypothetical protein C1H46_022984 [Malus baccata]|uniref:DNA-directed RNA polymerase M/15kDa subunit domain-containing protein n=1 Tax=Malus baccata TaxID=106549 RepID=A0A540LYD8_MALBA|nr:hypothetical protein C1H46_022984 [Malus baccata]